MKINKDIIKRILLFLLNILTWLIALEVFFSIILIVFKDNDFVFHLKSNHQFTYQFMHNFSNILGPSLNDNLINGGLAIVLLKISDKFIELFIGLK